jgi:hypothetical protein
VALTNENVTSQIDGIATDYYITGYDCDALSSFIVFHNGQKIHESEVTKTGPKTFTLSFIPKLGENLEVQYNDILTDTDVACANALCQ